MEPSGRGSGRHSDSLLRSRYCIVRKFVKRRAQTRRGKLVAKKIKMNTPNILGLIAWREIHVNTQLIMPLYDQDLRQFLRPNGVKVDVVVKLSRDLFVHYSDWA